jgi:hypothetical protein
MRIRVPRKRVRERFLILYELEGCKKAVNFLSEYYGIKKMKIIVNGKKVKRCEAYYFSGKAYFSKRGLKRRNVLHEFYHFLVDSKGLDMPESIEEKEANIYARTFLKI